MSIEIRKAARQDAEILSSLTVDVQNLHVDAEPGIFRPPDDDGFTVDVMRESLGYPDNYFFIAEIAGEAIGYIFIRHIFREENPYTYAREYLHIDQISVRPNHQGKGVGQALIAEAFRLADEKNIPEVNLATWGFNQDAQEFFKKMGFETYLRQMRRKPV